jgi:hypothetical protein
LRVVIKKFFALAFLRHEKTPAQIENNEDCDLRQVLHILSNDLQALVGDDISVDDVQDFLQYFNNTWMGRLRFWNVYGLNKNRTNNHMEGWHCHLVNTIQNNPNLWKFITKIKTEQTAKELEQNIMNQEAIIVPLTKKLKDKERRLARSKERYNGNEINPLEYVVRTSNLMNF